EGIALRQMLHRRVLRQGRPAMAARFVDGDPRRRKTRIGEGADGDGDDIGNVLQLPIDPAAATRAEVEADLLAAVALARVARRATLDRPDLVAAEARLRAEHAARAPLASQAMAYADPQGLAFAGDAELSAAAGCATRGHGASGR